MRVSLGFVVVVLLGNSLRGDGRPTNKNRGAGNSAAETTGGAVAVKAHSASLAASGERLFDLNCSMCHGKEGAGDGDLAVDIN